MNKHMVPRLIFWRTRSRHCFVPFLRRLETRVNVHNNAAIIKKSMMNQVTNGEPRPSDIRYRSHINFVVAQALSLFDVLRGDQLCHFTLSHMSERLLPAKSRLRAPLRKT